MPERLGDTAANDDRVKRQHGHPIRDGNAKQFGGFRHHIDRKWVSISERSGELLGTGNAALAINDVPQG